MTTIGISGAGGFIGCRTVQYFLEKGYKVKGLDNFYKGNVDGLLGCIINKNFEFIPGSVTNEKDCDKLVDGCDAIIHLAAIVGFPQCAKNELLAWDVNARGTKNIVQARNKISKKIPLIFTSTGSVYGAVTDSICTEKTDSNTTTVYGLSKLAAEKTLEDEDNIVIYRYATAFGVSPCMRVQLLVNDFVWRAHNEKIITVFEADFKRTFIHISDFIRALEFGIHASHNMSEKIFNCGDESLNWSKRQLAEYISKKFNCIVHFAETGKDLDVRNYEVDYSLLNSKGFKCKTFMEEGIDELVRAIPLLKIGNRYEPN